jgi:hypothetical protein
MRLTIEHTLTGPLSHKQTLAKLESAVAFATTLDEADRAVSAIPSLATYRGGSHIAIHPVWKGQFSNGSKRLAIIIEGAA